jgi:hypothetical protein
LTELLPKSVRRAVRDAHGNAQAIRRVAIRVVLDGTLSDDRVRDDQLLAVARPHDRRSDAELQHADDAPFHLEDVVVLHRALDHEDDAGDEVLRDGLHPEADGDHRHAADREERGQLHPEIVECDHDPDDHHDVVREPPQRGRVRSGLSRSTER